MIERRFLSGLEVRAKSDTTLPQIVGYAAVFNEVTTRSWYKEVILPGAFDRSLRENLDIRALVQHDSAMVIGRTKAKTLALRTDTKGLISEIDPPDTQVGRDTVESIRRGDIDGMSIGFIVRTDNWKLVDGWDYREISDIELIEVSPVTFPQYTGTSVQVRSSEMIGLDEETLLRALLRAKHKLPPREEDRALLAEVRAWLATEPQPTPPTIDPAIRLELDRRLRTLQLKVAA